MYAQTFYLFDKAQISCNTSAGQYIELVDAGSAIRTFNWATENVILGHWSEHIAQAIIDLGSLKFQPDYSTIEILYYQYDSSPIGRGGGWELDVWLTKSNETFAVSPGSVSYSPDGSPLNGSAAALPPCFVETGNCTQFWLSLGAVFDSLYWLYLADFGQISPTAYLLGEGELFLNATLLPSSNNPFVNSTLYEHIVNNLNGLAEWLTGNELQINVPVFNQSNGTFPLKQDDSVVLYQNYYCQQRQLKGPINLLLNVIAADYALIAGAYNFVILIGALIEKRRKEGTSDFLVEAKSHV
jgi:hypothetical protein